MMLNAPEASAQTSEQLAKEAAAHLRFTYVLTGDKNLDNTTCGNGRTPTVHSGIKRPDLSARDPNCFVRFGQ